MGNLLLRGGEGIEPQRQRIELRLPIAAVAIEPERSGEDRSGIDPAAADPAAALLRHQAGAHQYLDMARHRLQRNVERRSELGDQQIFTIQSVEYRASNRIGERAEHPVEDLTIGFGVIHGEMVQQCFDNNQQSC
jgi:hypothetical protein